MTVQHSLGHAVFPQAKFLNVSDYQISQKYVQSGSTVGGVD